MEKSLITIKNNGEKTFELDNKESSTLFEYYSKGSTITFFSDGEGGMTKEDKSHVPKEVIDWYDEGIADVFGELSYIVKINGVFGELGVIDIAHRGMKHLLNDERIWFNLPKYKDLNQKELITLIEERAIKSQSNTSFQMFLDKDVADDEHISVMLFIPYKTSQEEVESGFNEDFEFDLVNC